MELSKLNTTKSGDAGSTLHLTHPVTGELLYHDSDEETGKRPLPDGKKPQEAGRPMTITGYGADSNKYRRISSDILRGNTGNKKKSHSTEEILAFSNEHLASIITGWTEFTIDGEQVPMTKANALNIFTDWKWLREQWDTFVHDRANFLQSA